MTAYNETAVTLAASAARGTSGTAAAVDLGVCTMARLVLACSAVSGTGSPTLTVTVQTSPDQLAWTTATAFTARTTVGTQEINVAGCSRYVRAIWTIAGTGPSFTFGVSGSAFVVYCSPTDLYGLAIPQRALADITADTMARAIKSASEDLDGRFNRRYTFPLVSWSTELTQHAAELAAFTCLTTRGTSLDGQDWDVLKDIRDSARSWAKGVGNKSIDPPGIVDSTATVDEAGPVMYTNTKRGWGT
ncbi:MAG: hypothetical protein PHU49_13415 [Syntrophorhabdaceae bacterium]|nr:hypothetical protein [Syntrophorhabdaceae bacterium]